MILLPDSSNYPYGTEKSFLIGLMVVSAIVTFILSRLIWPDVPGAMAPSGVQLPFLIIISAIESIAFGIGLAFLVSLWPFMKGRNAWEWLAFISAAWLLMSWWPHDNLHRTMTMGVFWQLIRIEWAFHFTLIVAGIIVASVVWKQFAMQKQ